MISTVEVAFADVSAVSLRWALGLPPRPALGTVVVGSDHGPRLELRLLGASHQVLVHGSQGVVLSETVACDLPEGLPLPEQTRAGGYDLRTDVRRLEPDPFVVAVGALAAEGTARDDALVGRYPGSPHATTVLTADEVSSRRVAWTTWHAYPQTGELVRTRTRLSLPEVLG